jgi:immune inhibitor A
MKKYIFVYLMLLFVSGIQAMPARRNTSREVTLANGTKVTAFLKGDENGHWWETADGQYLVLDENGNATVLSAFEKENKKQIISRRRQLSNDRRASRAKGLSPAKTAITGKKKGLVILVNYKNKSMTTTQPNDYFNRQFNEEGFSDNNHIGSVRDYFYDQSYGKLDIQFDVIGPVTVSKNLAYYGQNDDSDNDKYPCTLVTEACKLADSQVNFADYDWDGDGEVDQVYVLYAGYGENSGADDNTIWPHEWALSAGQAYGDGSGALTLDGVKIDTYAVSCELAGTSGRVANGIGTACHEFSHCLGLPDFYDTSTAGTGWGMDAWDVMCSGSYNGPDYIGEIPCGYTSYERWYSGWLEPTELKVGMKVDAQKPLNDSPEAYILYNDNFQNEYYLLENRQSSRWFSYVSECPAPSGLLILHVDYDESEWANNTPNADASHQRMTMFLANNKKGSYTSNGNVPTAEQYSGHLYPYNSNDSLTNTSIPAATLFNVNTDDTKYMNKGICGITKNSDGTISYYCKTSSTTSGQGETETGDCVFYESFDKCSGTGGNDGKWKGDIAKKNLVTDNEGWQSENARGAYKCAKFGTMNYAGKATSPSFNLNGDATLSFLAGSWMGDGETIDVYMGETLLGMYDIPNGMWTKITIPVTGNGRTALVFMGENRFFLDEVKVIKTETDGIKETVANGKTTGHIYSIMGLDLGTDIDRLSEGVYIYNGKKYIKK